MKINGNEIRTGNIVEYQGRLMRAAKVHIVQMGNGAPILQVELRDIRDGTKLNERIRPADTIERVQLDEKHVSVPLQGRRPVHLHGQRDLRADQPSRRI